MEGGEGSGVSHSENSDGDTCLVLWSAPGSRDEKYYLHAAFLFSFYGKDNTSLASL